MSGIADFNRQYEEWYGDRWAGLVSALYKPSHKVSLLNPFASQSVQPAKEFVDWPVHLQYVSSEAPLVEEKLQRRYDLDLASVAAAVALPLEAGNSWLDLCAAPGGKALANIFRLNGQLDTTVNEVSATRLTRLKAVMHDYLPAEHLNRLTFSRRDGLRWHNQKDRFHAVLVDAPCSGERHLLAKPSELSHWSIKRSKGLAMRQFALLCSALETVITGGHLIYSTCSLSPLENDQVIDRFLERRDGRVEVVESPLRLGIRTKYGIEIHPDRTGWGPIYYTLLKRTN